MICLLAFRPLLFSVEDLNLYHIIEMGVLMWRYEGTEIPLDLVA